MDALQSLYAQIDAVVKPATFKLLVACGHDENFRIQDPTTRGLPFIDSPTPLLLTIAGYLLMVFVGLLTAPKAVPSSEKAKKKDGPALRLLMTAHNMILIVLSAWMSYSASAEAYRLGYKFWGQGYNPRESRMAWVVYVFFVSKIYEFMDTVVMLLKGNVRQVTFLHVYHHTTISTIWWVIARSAPGGDAWYSVMLNSLVHVVMYVYYLQSMYKHLFSERFQQVLHQRIGRNVTRFQMSQFLTMVAQGAYTYFRSDYPKFFSRLLFFYILTLLAMFASFYVGKFGSSTKKQKELKKKQ